ncbi:MAG TPA: hypothetical protein P5164_08195 [Thermoanaerobaculia bacterium]|nr:hypothetical protein [Thermoanaerobaculia bacterium]
MLATLLVPGLGHALCGRRGRGAAYFGLVGAAFVLGLALGAAPGPIPARGLGAILTVSATHAVVLPALVVRMSGRGPGDPSSPSFEVATTYLVVAGVLNVLLAFDAWDVAGGRKP